MDSIEITWAESIAEAWRGRERQNRLPHAVMLAGPPGVGKRALAAWMVSRKLALKAGDLPVWPMQRPEHADLRWLTRPEDKTAILIDQVRSLIADLNLTSYSGHGKAAVIEPAQLMTSEAANSLLKTLEEPPGDALLVLVADRTGRLPATILSRCQRIDVRAPSESDALAWLDRLRPGDDWGTALRVAGGAPIAALSAAEQLDTARAMAADFEAVATAASSPVDVAAKWAGYEPAFVLEWLARQVQAAARVNAGDAGAQRDLAIDESVLQRMDSRNLFCYLDNINRLRGQAGGSYNVQLAFEELLIDWATQLRDVRPAAAIGAA